MYELSQAEFKRHLQAKIQVNPPLFPWETELADYPDYPDTSFMMQAWNEDYSIKQSINFKSFLPEKLFKISSLIYQELIEIYVILTVNLASKLQTFLNKNVCRTERIYSLVLKNLDWFVSSGKYFLLLLLLILLPASRLHYSSVFTPRVYLTYSNKEISISLKDLERVIQIDRTHKDWRFFQRYLSYNQFQKLQHILISPIKVHSAAMANFLYSSQGEVVLQRLGELIRGDTSKLYAEPIQLRTALILASREPSGLTLLNVLRKYPSSSVYIDLARTLKIGALFEKMIYETNQSLAMVAHKSDIQASISQAINFSELPDIQHQGELKVEKQTLRLYDSKRKRLLMTDIYLPQVINKIPVIAISHGLGTDSSNFSYLASHLASYGFAVIVPNHPLSTEQSVSLSDGGNEFYNRPLDIKYVLDELSKSGFKSRLNLEQVGVFGHSFGAYTALMLAGASLNFEQISKSCNFHTLSTTWNMSLLFQCRLQVSNTGIKNNEYNFRDKRVKAVVAVNPFTSVVFGKQGLSQVKVPMMMVASSDDVVTPALYEQIQPFSSINTQKYLVVLGGSSHFSVIGDGQDSIESTRDLVGDNPETARNYMKILTTPFFQTYLTNNTKSAHYLNAAYAKAISNSDKSLILIKSSSKNGYYGL